MVIEIDVEKCQMCGGLCEPVCVDICPTSALMVGDGKILVTEFLCEDCNECGFACPDKAMEIVKVTW